MSTWILLLDVAPFFFFLQAREREFVNARKAEEEYRCLQHMSRRLYRQEEEMQRKGQEARERRLGIREHN